jgi:alpha-D-xyloside xylohydrolase
MLRALFFEFPNDPASWLVDDEYFFGHDLLVAPFFDDSGSRKVYLPPGKWIDFQSGKTYAGAQWHEMVSGPIPVVVLVRDGAVVPMVKVAQSTDSINWKSVEPRAFNAAR